MDFNISKEEIFECIKRYGPMIPSEIKNKVQKGNLMMIGAYLSELLKEKQILLTFGRIDSSPLYYVENQKDKLHRLSEYFNSVKKDAYNLIKENRVLRDSELEPRIRVALREIKDFAVPLKVQTQNGFEIFWRWYLTNNDDVKNIISSKLNISLNSKNTPVLKETSNNVDVNSTSHNSFDSTDFKQNNNDKNTFEHSNSNSSNSSNNEKNFKNETSFDKQNNTKTINNPNNRDSKNDLNNNNHSSPHQQGNFILSNNNTITSYDNNSNANTQNNNYHNQNKNTTNHISNNNGNSNSPNIDTEIDLKTDFSISKDVEDVYNKFSYKEHFNLIAQLYSKKNNEAYLSEYKILPMKFVLAIITKKTISVNDIMQAVFESKIHSCNCLILSNGKLKKETSTYLSNLNYTIFLKI